MAITPVNPGTEQNPTTWGVEAENINDNLEFLNPDTAPIQNGTKPVTSGALFTGLAGKVNTNGSDRLLSAAEAAKLANTSGTNTGDETGATIRTKLGVTTLTGANTGDQDLSGYTPTSRTINSKPLTSNIVFGSDDIAEGAINKYFTESRVLATVLTAISFVTATAITATDSILSALGKLQAQITANVTAIGLKQDKNLTLNPQTGTAYTLDLTDNGKLVQMNNAAANTLTVPLNSTAAFPIGSQILIEQLGAGQVTFAPASGVTINQRQSYLKTAGQYALVTLIKTATDTWVLSGDLTA